MKYSFLALLALPLALTSCALSVDENGRLALAPDKEIIMILSDKAADRVNDRIRKRYGESATDEEVEAVIKEEAEVVDAEAFKPAE